MRKLILAVLACITLAACKEDNEILKEIELAEGTSTSQTVYADETQKPDGIKFKATAPWTATVRQVETRTANGNLEWLSLSAYEGKAGEQTLTLTLKVNATGEDRKAEIKIASGSTLIAIVVEQKSTAKDGSTPKPEQPEPSGSGTITNVNTNQSVKLTRVHHSVSTPDQVRILFYREENGQLTDEFLADFYNPLQNGKLKTGTYTVRPINEPSCPEMKSGDCGWFKSVLSDYGTAGTVKVDLNGDNYTFTFDISTQTGEQNHKLTGSFTGVPKYLNEEVKVTGITVSDLSKTIEYGGNFVLSATILPENATDKRYKWSSSDTTIATVDKNGVVNAVAAGKATITATSLEGNKTAACEVTVGAAIAVKDIKVEPTEIILFKGDYYQDVNITVLPENASDKTYTWESGNTSVAGYDGKGIQAKSAGNCTITFKTKDGNKTATLKITVKERESSGNGSFTAIDLSGKYEDQIFPAIEAKLTILSKNSIKLSFINDEGKYGFFTNLYNPLSNGHLSAGNYECAYPESGANGTFSSTDWGYGYAKKGIITVAVNGGNYTVTMNNIETTNGYSIAGSYTGKATYTNEYVEVSSVTLDQNALTLTLGEGYDLIATVLPDNAFNKNVKWSSSNPNAVHINEAGQIKTNSVGTSTITATTEDGAKTASCTVTVKAIPATGNGTFSNNSGQSIAIKRATQWINGKNPKEIDLLFYPETSTNQALYITLVRGNTDTGNLKAGTYSAVSQLQADGLGVKYSYSNTGTATVVVNGDQYTVTLNITTGDGIKITGSYSGKITETV